MLKRYGLAEVICLIIYKLRTFIIDSNIRLIRFPIDLRNKSQIDFGVGLTTGKGCRFEVEVIEEMPQNTKRLIFGNNIQVNDYVHITAAEKVVLEDNVLIASRVYISDCSHGTYGKSGIHDHPDIIPKERKMYCAPVTIKKNVWIGEGVCVLMGVTIGEGSIIGSNAVVSSNIPPYSIAVGIPAKVIKTYNFKISRWEAV